MPVLFDERDEVTPYLVDNRDVTITTALKSNRITLPRGLCFSVTEWS
ncbi:MAG: hypothetical protein ABII19_03860 [Patescibacteria group bacterium]